MYCFFSSLKQKHLNVTVKEVYKNTCLWGTMHITVYMLLHLCITGAHKPSMPSAAI